MSVALPGKASVVVIGGGVTGSSVAYHLAKLGWSDVVQLERSQFSCGTTWHAAGLIGTMRANENHAKMAEYSMSILRQLEEETGQSTGFRQVGSLSIAHSEARFEELKRVASMNNAFGITQVDMLTPGEVKEIYPFLKTDDLLGASYVPSDGFASPVDVTMAFVKGARQEGAQCIEGVTVDDVLVEAGKVVGVTTDHGDIQTDYVVNCGGMWARNLGKKSGVNIPLHACEHYYAVTEKLADLPDDLPVMRDHDRCAYYKQDAGSLLVGAFEKKAVVEGHMEDQLMPVLEDAMQRVPMLQETGWRKFFCGPESFTPDDQFHIGEAPEVKNYFVAAGLNSIGIQSAGGLGKALAEWMINDHPPLDLWGNDIRRMHPFQGTQKYLEARVTETLGLLYDNHYPYRQMETSRNVRHSPVHERLEARGACFGESAGWERPNWFAPKGVEPRYEYSFGKQNWFAYSAAEHKSAREGVVLFDQSSFSKYSVQGRDACSALQRICSANVDVPAGKRVYTHWLNKHGGIEADLTVTRISENEYFIISGAAVSGKDMNWLQRHIPDEADCFVNDVTNAWAVLGVMGPDSKTVLSNAIDTDFSTEVFPFGSVQNIELGCAVGRAGRVSYVGELGWELYLPVDQARHGFDYLMQSAGEDRLKMAGMHALDSCRIEKKFVHLGHDIGDEDTPLECGLSFVCDLNKDIPFIGYDAIAKQRETGSWKGKRLVQFLLEDPEVVLYHHEPILRGGKMVGHLTSGNYGHTLGGAVGLGYVYAEEGVTAEYLAAEPMAIEVGGVAIPAKVSLRAMYDPSGERMRT